MDDEDDDWSWGDDLPVARRMPDETWDERSSSGGGMPEEVFDRAARPRRGSAHGDAR